MPQLASVTLTDSALANHVYTPMSVLGAVSTLTERTGAPIGDPSITVSLKEPRNGASLFKSRVTFKVPEVITVDGVDKVDFTTSFFLDVVSSDRATEAQIVSHIAQFVGLLTTGTIVYDGITKREPLY